jgi:hypothetical protein
VVEKEKRSGGKEDLYKAYLYLWLCTVTLFNVTLLAVLPAGIWFRVFGTDRLLQFSQIPYSR